MHRATRNTRWSGLDYRLIHAHTAGGQGHTPADHADHNDHPDEAAFDVAAFVLPRDSVEYASGCYEACQGTAALLVLTEWEDFRGTRSPPCQIFSLRYPIVIDGRNLFEPETMRSHAFNYYSMGRPDVLSECTRHDKTDDRLNVAPHFGYSESGIAI